MKARIIVTLKWKLNGEIFQRSIVRNSILKYLEESDGGRGKEITHVLKGLTKGADIIYIDMDENATKTAQKLTFKYEENREYEENSKEVDLINEEEFYNLFKDFFCSC